MTTTQWGLLYVYGYILCFWVLVDESDFTSLRGILALFLGCSIWFIALPGTILRQRLR